MILSDNLKELFPSCPLCPSADLEILPLKQWERIFSEEGGKGRTNLKCNHCNAMCQLFEYRASQTFEERLLEKGDTRPKPSLHSPGGSAPGRLIAIGQGSATATVRNRYGTDNSFTDRCLTDHSGSTISRSSACFISGPTLLGFKEETQNDGNTIPAKRC